MSTVRAAGNGRGRAPRAHAGKPSHARLAQARDTGIDSPARDLQGSLAFVFEAPEIANRWSQRSTLLFILGSCGLFWSGVILAVRAI